MALVHTVTVKYTFSDGDAAAEFARDIVDPEIDMDPDDYDVESIEVADASTQDVN